MTPERRAKLEAAGHKVQSAEDFFGLDEADRRVVAIRLQIAGEIRRMREEQGLSQRELAARIEVTQSRVAGFEKGRGATLDAMLGAFVALGGQLPEFGGARLRRIVKRIPTYARARRYAAGRGKLTPKPSAKVPTGDS